MTVLRMTEATVQNIVRLARIQAPSETCGFIVADNDEPRLGKRAVWMQNVAENPLRRFVMDPSAIRLAYGEFDQTGEEPIAVFHSHPASGPDLSMDDLREAHDPNMIYLVVSLETKPAKMRAFTVQQFIGNPTSAEVPIEVTRPNAQPVLLGTDWPGPWALLPGNYVRIGYQRTGKTALSSTVTHVIGCDGTDVRLDPDHKTGARSIPLERIRTVHVLIESQVARDYRKHLRLQAGDARTRLAGTDIEALPALLATLHRAYPPGITITMDEAR